MKNEELGIQAISYSNSREHISDELRRLDMLIRLQILVRRKGQAVKSSHQFRGLVLEENEIDCLLSDNPNQPDINSINFEDPDILTLRDDLTRMESLILERLAVSLKEGIYLTLPVLSDLFQLTRFEEQCLLICLATEIDRKYEKLYAYLQDDVTLKKPSVDLVLNLLCRTMQEKLSARPVFAPVSPLIKYRLLEMTDETSGNASPLISKCLRPDDRITGFLLGFGMTDARLEDTVRLIFPASRDERPSLNNDLRGRMKNYIDAHLSGTKENRRNILFHLCGPWGSGKRSLAKALCKDLKIPLISADMEKMSGLPMPLHEAVWFLCREVLLQQAALCIEHFDRLPNGNEKSGTNIKPFFETIRTFSRLTFITGSRPFSQFGLYDKNDIIEIEFPVPDVNDRKRLWEQSLNGKRHISSEADPGELAGKFRFTRGQLQSAITTAINLASWRSPDNATITKEDIHNACRAQSNNNLGPLASKVTPKYMWNDIVLPAEMKVRLREICNMMKYRQIVLGEWGYNHKFSLGKGLNVLFSGPSGTGKTMASEIIANELELDMYKIDLSQIVSKYIGETEKNLHRIFEEARTNNAILFFDEADALFGKRSEVRDAHDRYANIETAYLLQKMEEYDGVVVLATNLRGNMDDAFVRRIHFIIEFPFPDEAYREKIWKAVFPETAPVGKDIDFSFLARRFKLTGGNIRNISLGAAFLAAADGGTITMDRLIHAVRREYQKMGKLCVKGDFGEYYELLQTEDH